MSKEATFEFCQAMDNTDKFLHDYFINTLKQRVGDGSCGSVFIGPNTTDELEYSLRHADWKPYTHPSIAEGCKGFITHDLRGHLGIVALADLPPETMVTLDDRKNTGTISATVCGAVGPVVNYAVGIVGLEDGRPVVYTVHPGDPISPSKVKGEPGMHGMRIPASTAISMFDLQYAKIVAAG